MSDSLERLAKIQERANAATPGPWFASYAVIFSQPKLKAEQDFTDEIVKTEHTLERFGDCPDCPERGVGCDLYCMDLELDSTVAYVRPSYGDTPTGQRVEDMKFIEAARTELPVLADTLETVISACNLSLRAKDHAERRLATNILSIINRKLEDLDG